MLVESERIHAVGYRVAYKGDPVEDERWLGLLSREELAEDIEEDGEEEAPDGVNTEAHNGTGVH